MPATMREFIDLPEYLDSKNDTYRAIKDITEQIAGGIENRKLDESPFNEFVIVAGIGSGKSFASEVILAYIAHWLLCLMDAHSYFGLRKDKPIVLVNMGLSATQAKNVVFMGLKQLVSNSPFFKQFKNKFLTSEMQLDVDEESGVPRLHIISGNSNETMPIGMNVFGGILDEAAFYYDKDGRSTAENIYTAMQRRMVSRFKGAGMIGMISSPLYPEDFIMRKYEESKQYDFIYGFKGATWEMIDREKMPSKSFDFVSERDPDTNEPVSILKGIPVSFEPDFQRNPEKALRDYAAVPSLSIQGFFRDPLVIDAHINREGKHPIDDKGRLVAWFTPDDKSVPYFIHIDLALGKENGDACGFAMGHLVGYDEVKTEMGVEKRPKIKIDLMTKFRAEPGQELQFADIRQLIFALKDRGFYIKKVSYDSFQSVDSIQLLKQRGIPAEYLSVDTSMEPYYALKEAILESRLDYYNYPDFIRELKTLEEIKGKKVDHAKNSSKDVSDAVAGVCFHCAKGGQKSFGVLITG